MLKEEKFKVPLGPRHLLIYNESGFSLKDFLILSLGPKKGLTVGRVIEVVASSPDSHKKLMSIAESIIKCLGGSVLLIFSASSKLNCMLEKIKYKTLKDSPGTYFYHKNENDAFFSCSFNASAGDIGNGVIVHLWSHPHNFIDGDQMDILLDKVLELAGNTV